jgi:hypothetical protein
MNTQNAKRNFILQQGLAVPDEQTCGVQYSALQFQPRIVGLTVLLGVIFQSPVIFLLLAAVLWWSGLRPRWNPFDAFYNSTLARRKGALKLSPAPPPRRFAAKESGTFALVIGVSLLSGWNLSAYALEAILLAAVIAVVFGGFCAGTFTYHALNGKIDFAIETLPWAKGGTCSMHRAA